MTQPSGFLPSRKSSTLPTALWYGVCVLAGIVLVQSATPWGIGIRHDSLFYLTSAQSLASSGCLCRIGSGWELKPLVHFGPLYPTLLWLVTLVSGNLLLSARWIASILYGVNLALWGGLVHVHTGRFWAGAIVSGILAVSVVMLQVHDAAMSEPLFLAILALALFALTDYLTIGRRRSLWLAAAAVAAAVLTRYAAGSLVALGILAIVLLRPAPWKARLGDALRFGAAAAAPVIVWLVRNAAVAGTATNRTLRWHPVALDDLRTFLGVVTAWYTAGTASHWLEGALLLAAPITAGIFLWRNRRTENGQADAGATLGLLLMGLAASYPAYVALSRSLFDDTIPIDDRMFSPVYVALTALFGVVLALASRRRRGRWVVVPAMLLLLAISLPYAFGRFREKYDGMRADGVLFAGRAWQGSESIAWFRDLPEEALVYSNQALILQFLADRAAYQLPMRADVVKGEVREDFAAQLARMRADLQLPGSYLLVFDAARPITVEDLEAEFKEGMRVLRETEDGFVMVRQDSGSMP